jgi:hypothetical protein
MNKTAKRIPTKTSVELDEEIDKSVLVEIVNKDTNVSNIFFVEFLRSCSLYAFIISRVISIDSEGVGEGVNEGV